MSWFDVMSWNGLNCNATVRGAAYQRGVLPACGNAFALEARQKLARTCIVVAVQIDSGVLPELIQQADHLCCKVTLARGGMQPAVAVAVAVPSSSVTFLTISAFDGADGLASDQFASIWRMPHVRRSDDSWTAPSRPCPGRLRGRRPPRRRRLDRPHHP